MELTLSAAGAPLVLAKPLQASRLAEMLGPWLPAADDRSLLLYVHVPFCSSKCTFCNWVSEIPVPQLRADGSIRQTYAASVAQQIHTVGPQLRALGYRPMHAYWGGGTPSILSREELETIIGALASVFDLSTIDEHAMETSPETLTAEKLQALRRLGVNRISMGVQSFDDQELRRAARAHSADQAVHAVHLIREAGFDNVNLDLIVGFPDQTREARRRTMERTLELGPPHVTVYVYRPEPNTVMARQIREGHRPARSLTDNLEAYQEARDTLQAAGYVEYSVGYFALAPRYRFKGEEYYFGLHGDYVGFGCGGESILGHHALMNPAPGLQRFLTHPAEFAVAERFSPERLDGVLRALRLTILTEDGIVYRRFERLFGFPFAAIREHPYVKGLVEYLTYCGAEFVDTGEQLYVTEASRARSYIVSIQRAFYESKGRGDADRSRAAGR